MRKFVFSLVLSMSLAAATLGAPNYFDGKPNESPFAADKPVVNGATWDDIRQPNAPTCSLMASLSAAARSGIDLSRNIRHLGDNEYAVNLFLKGSWSQVRVTFDGWLPLDPAPNDPGEFWPALFQRAYLSALNVDCSDADIGKWASVKLGSKTDPQKDFQEWCSIHTALAAVTGQTVEGVKLDQGAPAATVKFIREAFEQKRCVVLAIIDGSAEDRLMGKVCLVKRHAYPVTAVGPDWIEVRNPWGCDIDPARLTHKGWKNGRAIYAFKDGHGDGRDNDPNDGLVRLDLTHVKLLTHAVSTKEPAVTKPAAADGLKGLFR
jgi:hypothetical protein